MLRIVKDNDEFSPVFPHYFARRSLESVKHTHPPYLIVIVINLPVPDEDDAIPVSKEHLSWPCYLLNLRATERATSADHEAEVVIERRHSLVCQNSLAEEGPALDLRSLEPVADYGRPFDFPPEIADARRVVADCHCLSHVIVFRCCHPL